MRSSVFNALTRHPVLARPRRTTGRKAARVSAPSAPASVPPAAPAPPRAPQSKTPRVLTMSSRRWPLETAEDAVVPYLRMSGRWLEEHGFEIGGKVYVTAEQGKVTLTKSTSTTECDPGIGASAHR